MNFKETSKAEFEKLKIEGLKGLTACAGIAYVKDSYPLHYALHLAEELCGDAKKKVKQNLKDNEIPKSSLAFYKVQDSFIDDLETLKTRTLKSKVWDFYAGPYLLEEVKYLKSKLTIIQNEADAGDKKTKAVGKLRQIISESYKDKATTEFMLHRMKDINNEFFNSLELENLLIKKIDENSKEELPTSILLDLITLHSFNYGERNN